MLGWLKKKCELGEFEKSPEKQKVNEERFRDICKCYFIFGFNELLNYPSPTSRYESYNISFRRASEIFNDEKEKSVNRDIVEWTKRCEYKKLIDACYLNLNH